MNKYTEQYFSHAEPRVHYCIANALLWDNADDQHLAEVSRQGIYKWIGIAQEQHQEDHF